MTSSKRSIFRVTGHLCGDFTGFPTQRPVTRSFDVFFDLRLNTRLSKQSWGWWFETLSRPLWRHCNVTAPTPNESVTALQTYHTVMMSFTPDLGLLLIMDTLVSKLNHTVVNILTEMIVCFRNITSGAKSILSKNNIVTWARGERYLYNDGERYMYLYKTAAWGWDQIYLEIYC